MRFLWPRTSFANPPDYPREHPTLFNHFVDLRPFLLDGIVGTAYQPCCNESNVSPLLLLACYGNHKPKAERVKLSSHSSPANNYAALWSCLANMSHQLVSGLRWFRFGVPDFREVLSYDFLRRCIWLEHQRAKAASTGFSPLGPDTLRFSIDALHQASLC